MSDFYKSVKGFVDYNNRTFHDESFKVQWRGTLLAATNIVLPILTFIGLGVATTIYFEKENKIRESTISTMNLESSIME